MFYLLELRKSLISCSYSSCSLLSDLCFVTLYLIFKCFTIINQNKLNTAEIDPTMVKITPMLYPPSSWKIKTIPVGNDTAPTVNKSVSIKPKSILPHLVHQFLGSTVVSGLDSTTLSSPQFGHTVLESSKTVPHFAHRISIQSFSESTSLRQRT